jgi:protease-4
MFSTRRQFTDEERDRYAATIDAIYDEFVGKVAQGRGRFTSEIESVARGRVWTGSDALGIGLVDELGGLRDAMRIARERGGLAADAPVRPALHVPPLARLGRPKNSDDPRAGVAGASGMADLAADIAAAVGLPPAAALLLPSVTVR